MPQRAALSDGQHSISFAHVADIVNEEARWLESKGGQRFAIMAPNGCGWALTDLALHRARRLNVPLPDWFTPSQTEHALDDAGIDSIVTDRPHEVLERWSEFHRVDVSARTGLALMRRALEPERQRQIPPGVSKITYTSGSTASPKGVCLTAEAIDAVARSVATATASLNITRHLCLLPLPTLLENIAGLYVPIATGATCLLPPASATGMNYGKLDAARVLKSIVEAQPESLILVPELLRVLVQAAESGWRAPRSLKFIAVGGATVSKTLLEQAASLKLPIFEGYGLSECASVVCLSTPQAHRMGSVGLPLPHAQVRTDAQGQLLVRGATMSGYLGEMPMGEGQEIATGDLGEIDADGYVYVRGRQRNIFITSFGRNLSPEWIEGELTTEPIIRHAFACGEARPFVAALLSPTRARVDIKTLADAVDKANARLPEPARIRQWALMPQTPSLANGLLTANGRLRRDVIAREWRASIEKLFEQSRAGELR